MSLAVFLEVVEIRTKVASIFPFIMGILFSLVYFHEFHPLNTVIFFVGMILFDLTTTSINNYMDFKKAKAFIADGISRMLYRGVLYLWAGSLISDAIGGSL